MYCIHQLSNFINNDIAYRKLILYLSNVNTNELCILLHFLFAQLFKDKTLSIAR